MLIKIFTFIWKKWLENDKVIKITGWRSCLADKPSGQRVRYTFMFDSQKDL